MSESKSERHAAWRAVEKLTTDMLTETRGKRETHQGLADLRLQIETYQRTHGFEEGVDAFDVCSEALGVVDGALRRETDDALDWLEAQVKINVARAAEKDSSS